MTVLCLALGVVALCGWIQAERVIAHQRRELAMSRAVIDCQQAAVEELQEAVHDLCTMERPEPDALAPWGVQIH